MGATHVSLIASEDEGTRSLIMTEVVAVLLKLRQIATLFVDSVPSDQTI